MKKIGLTVAVACAAAMAFLPLAAEMPRSEWHAKVGDCAQNPALLKQTISQLSAADQCAFLSEVNDALAKMPGSTDAKAAAFLAANRAAVTGATPDNRAPVLAEVFATVPPEYLTVINENFAGDLFNRNANPARTYSDVEYRTLCSNAMTVVIARNATAENAAARNAFAIMMFVRASGDAAPNAELIAALTGMMPESGDTAKDWLADALGDSPSYDRILGDSQAGDEPVHPVVTALDPAQGAESLLHELAADRSMDAGRSRGGRPGIFSGSAFVPGASTTMRDVGIGIVPRAAINEKTIIDPRTGEEIDNPYYNKKRGSRPGAIDEPILYPGQE